MPDKAATYGAMVLVNARGHSFAIEVVTQDVHATSLEDAKRHARQLLQTARGQLYADLYAYPPDDDARIVWSTSEERKPLTPDVVRDRILAVIDQLAAARDAGTLDLQLIQLSDDPDTGAAMLLAMAAYTAGWRDAGGPIDLPEDTPS